MKTGPLDETPIHFPRAENLDTCRYVGKALRGNPRTKRVDVDALLESLESRNALRRGPDREAAPAKEVGAQAPLADVLEFRVRVKNAKTG